ncbi:hypothetical protein TWF730_003541 [Orbilia blumenaviensis]|uniref:Uncharacterized protein n=1 Tax=Orbilia blumenaviensis TaxID=1796055 RepID=A0AAV9U5U8_9PEZI
MEAVSKLVGCCGCGRSGESSSSRGQHQSRTDAVIDTQPGPVEPPMVVRVARTVRQFTTRRRLPKPTWEELEAFYEEGKELARLQEEAEAAEKLERQQKSEERQQQPQQQRQDNGQDLAGKDRNQSLVEDAAAAPLPSQPHMTYDGASETPLHGEENEPRLPPAANFPPRRFSRPGLYFDSDLRRVSNHNDRPLPALVETGENMAISEADTDEIDAVLAAPDPDIACGPPNIGGTQASKKMRLFFQDDRSRSSVYPSDEESMVYPPGTWSPRSTRIISPSPAPGRLAVNKTRKNRYVSPGNLRIPSIMERLGGVLSPSLTEAPNKLPSPQKPVDFSELPHPDEFELTTDPTPVPLPDGEYDIQSLPDPDEFGFVEILLTPIASPFLSPQPDRSISPIFSGMPFLKLEMERIRRRIESETLYIPPWDKPVPDVTTPSDTQPTQDNPTTNTNGMSKSAYAKNGIFTIGTLDSLSSLSLATNLSAKAIRSTSSTYFSPSALGSGFESGSEEVLSGLSPCAEAEAPIHDTVTDVNAGTFAENLLKGGETIAKTISNGFATLFKRFGTGTAELQSQEPAQPTANKVHREPARAALSCTEGTPALSPTPSNLTLMRRIVGLKVSGTLCAAPFAGEAMSSGLFTSDYTNCGPDDAPENPFEGFVWDAPDGKIPWYCDEDGVHFDDKVPVIRHIPSEYLRDPVIVPWEELSAEKAELPKPSPSTGTGPKGVRVRQLTPPVATAPSTVAIEGPSGIASPATTQLPGSLVRSAGLETRMPEEPQVPSASTSVDSFPRYIPTSNRDARHSTCGLDLGKERAFYQRYEDRIKAAVKPFMRGRRSFQRY